MVPGPGVMACFNRGAGTISCCCFVLIVFLLLYFFFWKLDICKKSLQAGRMYFSLSWVLFSKREGFPLTKRQQTTSARPMVHWAEKRRMQKQATSQNQSFSHATPCFLGNPLFPPLLLFLVWSLVALGRAHPKLRQFPDSN